MSLFSNTKIISITNQKGGVGKTTTTINLATALASVDKKVLVVDFDPQGNASTGFGIEQNDRVHDVYSFLLGKNRAEESIRKTKIQNLDIIPASIDLSAAEIELSNTEERTGRLRELFAKSAALAEYDYILIDCPPALGFLTLNSLAASDSVLVPLQCEFFALEGVSHLMNTIQLVQQNVNPTLRIEGVVLTMYDKRNKLSELVEKDVRGCFGEHVFDTVIPRNVRISEAPSHGKPVILYDFNCAGSKSYINLAAEFLMRSEKRELKMAA
jgi:chromosome partitioning protein